MGPSPYRGPVDRCVACGAELGVGRFCLNCGHPVGAPAPEVVEHQPIAPPVQAADPTPVAPTSPPDLADEPPPEPDGEPEDAPAVATAPPAPPASTAPARKERTARKERAPRKAPAGRTATVVPPAPRHEWDPREDLLPYEEVDDLDEPPIQGRAWIFWVAGAVLLVALVFLLLRVFGTEGEEVATDTTGDTSSAAPDGTGSEAPAEEAEATTEVPRGVGRVLNLAAGATFEVPGTAPPTTDFDGNLVAYESTQMGDGNTATAWRTAGDATGESITVTLRMGGVVTRVGLVNGYSKQVAGVDWYPNNRRILAVTWQFDDGATIEQTFAERPGMQRIKVPPTVASTVTITITSVTPPGTGNLGRDYTAISEVAVLGRHIS